MHFIPMQEISEACTYARTLGYSIEPGLTIADKRCCPLGAVLIARGLRGEWAEGTSDWLDLADLLHCDPDEVEAFTNTFDGVPGAIHPFGAVLERICNAGSSERGGIVGSPH